MYIHDMVYTIMIASNCTTQFAFVISSLWKKYDKNRRFWEWHKKQSCIYLLKQVHIIGTLVAFAQITFFVKMSGLGCPWHPFPLFMRSAPTCLCQVGIHYLLHFFGVDIRFSHTGYWGNLFSCWVNAGLSLITRCLVVATQVCFWDCHNVLSGLLGIRNTPVFLHGFHL
jgi:hypothetical protein